MFVQDSDPKTIKKVARLFAKQPGIAEVLTAEGLAEYRIDHPRSGDVVLVSDAEQLAGLLLVARRRAGARSSPARSISTASPATTRSSCSSTPARRRIPLNANLVRGSHGAPAKEPSQRGVLLTSEPGVFLGGQLADTQVADIVLKQFAEE